MKSSNNNRFPSDKEAARILRQERPTQAELDLVRAKFINDARSILMKKNPVIRERERAKKRKHIAIDRAPGYAAA